ncbi:MAG: hypothetical protein ACRDHY_17270 [Anaerolineales bacterium]
MGPALPRHRLGPVGAFDQAAGLKAQLVDLAELPGWMEAHVDVQLSDEILPCQKGCR